jgi:hypothetical protein
MLKKIVFAFVVGITSSAIAQEEDLLALVNEPEVGNVKVFATFKTTKIVNAQSIETVKKGDLRF